MAAFEALAVEALPDTHKKRIEAVIVYLNEAGLREVLKLITHWCGTSTFQQEGQKEVLYKVAFAMDPLFAGKGDFAQPGAVALLKQSIGAALGAP